MQAVLERLLVCVGMSRRAETALLYEMDSDVEALLKEPPASAPQGSGYFVSYVSRVFHSMDPKLKREDAYSC